MRISLAVIAIAALPVSALADEVPAARSPRLLLQRPQATITHRADPARWNFRTLVEFNPIDNAALARIAAARTEPGRPREVGVVRPVPGNVIDPVTHGQWSTEPDGTRIWRLELYSSGARTMRVHFSTFDLPDGASVTITGADPALPSHEYKGIGPLHSRTFWSRTVHSDRVLIEYRSRPEVAAAPFIEIDAVVHDFISPFDNVATERGDLLPCQIDVTCENVNAAVRDSVGQMSFIDGGSSYVCTGVLLNDVDLSSDTPWFITANHCLSTQQVASTLDVTWFYQTATCNGVPPSRGSLPDSLGATLLATNANTDFTFLQLTEQPPGNVGFAGWSSTAASGALIGVHHPGGTHKRYSAFSIVSNPSQCNSIPNTRYLYLNQDDGVTEGGSSGSPVVNTNNQVVGQLYGTCGGESNCSAPPKAVYGRFNVSYANNALAQYLFTQPVTDDNYENNDSFDLRVDIDEGLFNLQLMDADDYYEIVLPQASRLTIEADFSTVAMDLDLYLYRVDTTLIDSSVLVGPTETIIRALPAGTYVLRANRYSGTGGSYTLTIDVETGLVSDLNDDGQVAIQDIALTLLGFGLSCSTGPTSACPDLDGDDLVTINDLAIVLRDYGYRRAEFKNAKWKKEMKTLYNLQLRPLMDPRTGRQKKQDLKNLNTVAP